MASLFQFGQRLLQRSTTTSFNTLYHQLSRSFASKKHKNILTHTKGFRGRSKNCYTIALRRLEKAWQYAYRDRKRKRRQARQLWIMRVQAGCRQYGWRYSSFIPSLAACDINLNRKVLADLAANEPFSFRSVVAVVEQQQQNHLQPEVSMTREERAA